MADDFQRGLGLGCGMYFGCLLACFIGFVFLLMAGIILMFIITTQQ